jgi:hypothetical protein
VQQPSKSLPEPLSLGVRLRTSYFKVAVWLSVPGDPAVLGMRIQALKSWEKVAEVWWCVEGYRNLNLKYFRLSSLWGRFFARLTCLALLLLDVIRSDLRLRAGAKAVVLSTTS